MGNFISEAVHHHNDQNLVNGEPVHDQGYIQSAGEPENINATEEAEQNASPLDHLDVKQTAENPEIDTSIHTSYEDCTWPIEVSS